MSKEQEMIKAREALQAHLLSGKHVDAEQVQMLLNGGGGMGAPHLMSLSPSDVHVNAALTNVAVFFQNADYVADELLPVLVVNKRSDAYFKFNPEVAFTKVKTDLATSRGMPNEIRYTITSDTYSCNDHALMDFTSRDTELNADQPLDPLADSTELTMNFMHLMREVRVAALVFATASYGTNTAALAGTARFDDYVNSDPIGKIELAIDTPLVRPNRMVLGRKTYRVLRQHPKLVQHVISRSEYAREAQGRSSMQGTPLRVNAQMIAEAFELDRVIVPDSRYNTAADGATAAFSRIWDEDKLAVLRVEETPAPRRVQTFGYTFRFKGDSGQGVDVQQWFDQRSGVRGGTWVKVGMSDDEKLVAGANAGYLYTTVVS